MKVLLTGGDFGDPEYGFLVDGKSTCIDMSRNGKLFTFYSLMDEGVAVNTEYDDDFILGDEGYYDILLDCDYLTEEKVDNFLNNRF